MTKPFPAYEIESTPERNWRQTVFMALIVFGFVLGGLIVLMECLLP